MIGHNLEIIERRVNKYMKSKKMIWCGVYFFIICTVLLFLSSRTSPLYSLLLGDYGKNEAATAMLIGKYWIQGEIPYKDLFAVGGPIYFLIQAIGWMIGERSGILILQGINLFACMIIMQKIVHKFQNGWRSWGIPAAILFVYIATCSGGNSASEWCLTLLAVGLWISLQEQISSKSAMLFGVILGLGMMIHIQSSGMLYGIFIWMLWTILKQEGIKKFRTVFGWIGIGYMIVVVPIVLYFSFHGAINVMIKGAILYPLKELTLGFDSIKVVVHKMVKCFLMLPVLCAGLYQIHKKDKKNGILIVFISVVMILLLLCGDNQWYYYIVVMPCLALAIAIWSNVKAPVKRKAVVGCCMVLGVGICIIPIKNYVTYLKDGVPDVVEEFITDVEEYRNNLVQCRIVTIDTDSSYLLELDEKPIISYFSSQSELELYEKEIGTIVESYVDGDIEADIVVTTEKGWVGQHFEEYILVQVYCKKGGNICIYLPND